MKIQMSVEGNVYSQLFRFQRNIGNAISLTLKSVGDELKRDTRQRIAVSKTDPMGVRWAPWSFATLNERIRKGTAGLGLLYDTGTLWRSVDYNVRGNVLELGSSVEYAKYLQRGRPNMPARQIVNMNTPRTRKMVKNHLLKHLKRGLK